MPKHYLFFVSLTYAYSILRPLEEEIRHRGDKVAWYIEPSCDDLLLQDEVRLNTFAEVKQFDPLAVFSPGNWVYDFFPGIKVEVFHGYPINKRNDKVDDHFRLRGWFDVYCTQGESSTTTFKQLEAKYKYFKVYETGWCKVDSYFKIRTRTIERSQLTVPTVFVATTFSKHITSLAELLPVIRRLASTRPWHWIITLHPKLTDPHVRQSYVSLSEEFPNVEFKPVADVEDMLRSDVMLCDSSSIIIEYMLLDKPVVTYRNTRPGKYLIDVQHPDEIAPALELAMTRPADLMENIHQYSMWHEPHRDGQNSARILDAVDDFVAHYQGRIKRKPLNLIRRLKLRWRLKYFRW